jgi:eukaryotic-like serine/threonine-protein kinase
MSPPQRLSHYELLDPIGRDGAAEIYRARDLRLDRDVAVKMLRPDEMAKPGAVERFRREARLASLVSHPHICAVHDSGEHAGQPFIVCELLEGRALDELLAGAPLAGDRVLEIAMQLSDALVASHRRGLIHGNLKPSNIFITTDGHVKLLELGAASAAPGPLEVDAPTAAGITRAVIDGSATTSVDGTAATGAPIEELFHPYLAPEQVAGAPVDARADIFTTGTLLYQMTTGSRPFDGETPGQLASAIVRREPARPRAVDPALGLVVEPIIVRALAKDPAQRYQAAAELLEDLRRARRALDTGAAASRRGLAAGAPGRLALAAGVLVALLATVAFVSRGTTWWHAGPATTPERHTMLVSQIVNGTGDPDFDGTLREAVTVYLAQSPHLDLASDERIRATLQLMGRSPDAPMSHAVASEVCQRLGLQAMLEGSVSAVGRETVLALAATDCHSGATIARQQVSVERKEDVLGALGPLTEAVRTSLGESSASLARHNVRIEEATTPSLEALKAFTEGTARRAAGAEIESISFFERAITLDDRFALAYATLSTIYGGLGETGRSEEFARLAYERRDHVSERERLFITSQYHDRFTGDQIRARETLEVWKRTYPRDYRAPNALAVLLNRLGEYEAAAAEAEEAIRRNPAHAFPYSNLAYAHRGAGRYTEARSVAEDAIARGIETMPMRRLLYQLAELAGDERAARAELEWAAANRRGFDLVGARAQAEAARGRIAQARALYRQTIDTATAEGFAQIASGYAAQAALTDALYGYPAPAREEARRTVRAPVPYEPQLRAATALALAGAVAEAEAVVERLRGVRPDDTLLHAAYLPAAQAAVLIGRGQPAAAIEELRRAARYETGLVAALIPTYLRGEARHRAGEWAEAVREFQAVLDHRGADPFSPVIPLAQLGQARALHAQGDAEASRRIYEGLLEAWRGADPDLPALQAARAELAALHSAAR